MRARGIRRFAVILACTSMLATGAAWCQETFRVLSVDATGCNSGDFAMTVERANLDGGSYTVNTVVTVASLVYMNEAASISINGLSGWNIFDNFSAGAVPNQGSYPIPANQVMQLDFSLQRPVGTVLYQWRLRVDGCNTGNILFNGPPALDVGAGVPVPAMSPLLIALQSLALASFALFGLYRIGRRT